MTTKPVGARNRRPAEALGRSASPDRVSAWRLCAEVLLLALLAFAAGPAAAVPAVEASNPAAGRGASPATGTAPGSAARGVAFEIAIDGPIGPATVEHVRRGLASAVERGARVVVLRIDTPGGLDRSMRQIVQAILASPVPVVAHVAPQGARAASAGAYLVYASHVAAMAPATSIGAATPVALGRGDGPAPPADVSAAKAINDAAAYLRSLAQLRGRDATFADEAVRDSASLTAEAALDRGVIDLVAADVDTLLARIEGREVALANGPVTLATRDLERVAVDPGWLSRLLAVVTDPNVALLLMAIGFYGLLFEFMSPGAVVPGTVGAISLLLGLYALSALPLDLAGAALLLLGLALLVAEVFVPSFGILGLGGAIAATLGAAMLIDTDGIPGFGLRWPVLAAIGVTTFGIGLAAARAAWRASKRRAMTGGDALIGMSAEVEAWHDEQGHVQVQGERWNATGTAAPMPGQRVRIVARDGLTLVVAPERPPPDTGGFR